MPVRHQSPLWLNAESRAHVEAALDALVTHYHETLLGVILFGSVARHEERSMDDAHPSDVDLLLIFNQDNEIVLAERLELLKLVGEIDQLHRNDLRELNLMIATKTLAEWDTYFLEHVARDGIVLYASMPLPQLLKALEIA